MGLSAFNERRFFIFSHKMVDPTLFLNWSGQWVSLPILFWLPHLRGVHTCLQMHFTHSLKHIFRSDLCLIRSNDTNWVSSFLRDVTVFQEIYFCIMCGPSEQEIWNLFARNLFLHQNKIMYGSSSLPTANRSGNSSFSTHTSTAHSPDKDAL